MVYLLAFACGIKIKISNVMNLFTEKTIKPVILYMNRVFDGGSNEKNDFTACPPAYVNGVPKHGPI